jgi:hypothetical protein
LATNNILWANTSIGSIYEQQFRSFGGSPVLSFNCIQGWSPGGQPNAGNSGDAPQFLDEIGPDGVPGTGDELYLLLSASSAVNGGGPAAMLSPGAVDIRGASRVQCGRIDMGCFEGALADMDCDGLVDLTEFSALHGCLSGPGVQVAVECKTANLWPDREINLRDLAMFQIAYHPIAE